MSLAELRFSLSQSPLLGALKILVFRWALGGPGDYYTGNDRAKVRERCLVLVKIYGISPIKLEKRIKKKNTNINMNRARSYCLPKHRT